jgi:histidinol-phosphate/aromatic aminotransferase/cobyric acid decarboxylase-like protein
MVPSAETIAVGPARRVHGGLSEEESRALGLDPAGIVDFSVSCNPYGPCAEVVESIRAAPIDCYPDPAARPARRAIARMTGAELDEVALGNGACDLLWTLARVLALPGAAVVVVEPTFCEFRAAADQCGAVVHEWRAHARDGFAIDLGEVERLARERAAAAIYICSPNTPTGVSVPIADLVRLAEADPSLAIVLDQSFLSLSERALDASVRMPANVVRVRSMTKEHAIPGVRLAYLLAAPWLVRRVDAARPSWTTSAAAQAAAVAACGATGFVDESRARLLRDRDEMAAMLRRLGLEPSPSTTCFLLAPVGDARRLRARLLERHGVLVRDCESFGLSGWIRVAARPEEDRRRLEAALGEELPRC